MALQDDRLKWNRRYRERSGDSVRPEPHPLALRWRDRWIGGAMLDAACGWGRGIASAADAFRPIYAVDLSEVAVRQARALWGESHHIRWIVADVASLSWPRGAFGLVCAFGFTDMDFFARAPAMLRGGGMFLSEGFSERTREVKPALDPDWIARPEDLREIFAGGQVLECSISPDPPYRLAFAALAP